MGLLDGDMAEAIAAGFDGLLLAGTLRKNTTTSRDSFGDPVVTTADYAIQGLREDYTAAYRAVAGIPIGDCKILLIAGLCAAAPSIGDKINIAGGWFAVRNVTLDPALATYESQAYSVPSG